MDTNMYEIIIRNHNENSEARDVVSTLKDVVKFIARETGMTQREVRSELSARADTKFNRDNLGFRVEVNYN